MPGEVVFPVEVGTAVWAEYYTENRMDKYQSRKWIENSTFLESRIEAPSDEMRTNPVYKTMEIFLLTVWIKTFCFA